MAPALLLECGGGNEVATVSGVAAAGSGHGGHLSGSSRPSSLPLYRSGKTAAPPKSGKILAVSQFETGRLTVPGRSPFERREGWDNRLGLCLTRAPQRLKPPIILATLIAAVKPLRHPKAGEYLQFPSTSAAEAAHHPCHSIAAVKPLRHPKAGKYLQVSQFETRGLAVPWRPTLREAGRVGQAPGLVLDEGTSAAEAAYRPCHFIAAVKPLRHPKALSSTLETLTFRKTGRRRNVPQFSTNGDW